MAARARDLLCLTGSQLLAADDLDKQDGEKSSDD